MCPHQRPNKKGQQHCRQRRHVTPTNADKPSREVHMKKDPKKLLRIGIPICFVLLVFLWAIHDASVSRSRRWACYGNLLLIDGVKDQCYLQLKLMRGANVANSDLDAFI